MCPVVEGVGAEHWLCRLYCSMVPSQDDCIPFNVAAQVTAFAYQHSNSCWSATFVWAMCIHVSLLPCHVGGEVITFCNVICTLHTRCCLRESRGHRVTFFKPLNPKPLTGPYCWATHPFCNEQAQHSVCSLPQHVFHNSLQVSPPSVLSGRSWRTPTCARHSK